MIPLDFPEAAAIILCQEQSVASASRTQEGCASAWSKFLEERNIKQFKHEQRSRRMPKLGQGSAVIGDSWTVGRWGPQATNQSPFGGRLPKAPFARQHAKKDVDELDR